MLRITTSAYEKMMAYTYSTEMEITAFLLSEDRGKDHVIYDLSLPKQTVTDTSAEPGSKNMEEWWESLSEKQKLDFHGMFHSHNMMPPFASGDDEKTITSLLITMDWVITIITNFKNELYVRVDVTQPVKMTQKDVPLILLPDPGVMKVIQEEVNEKVKEEKFVYVQPTHYQTPHYRRDSVGGNDDGSGLLKGGGDDRALSYTEVTKLYRDL